MQRHVTHILHCARCLSATVCFNVVAYCDWDGWEDLLFSTCGDGYGDRDKFLSHCSSLLWFSTWPYCGSSQQYCESRWGPLVAQPLSSAASSALSAAGRFAQRSAEKLAANRWREWACLFTFIFSAAKWILIVILLTTFSWGPKQSGETGAVFTHRSHMYK